MKIFSWAYLLYERVVFHSLILTVPQGCNRFFNITSIKYLVNPLPFLSFLRFLFVFSYSSIVIVLNVCIAEYLEFVCLYVFCMFICMSDKSVFFSDSLRIYMSVALSFLISQLLRSYGQFTIMHNQLREHSIPMASIQVFISWHL